MRICSHYETEHEHNHAHALFHRFLRSATTQEILSPECISSCIDFAEKLKDKEKFLGNHHRIYITNCMDSMTTSPVESQNNIVHNKLGVRSNLNADRGIIRIVKNTSKSLKEIGCGAC